MIWKIDELILENENILRTPRNSIFEINQTENPISLIPQEITSDPMTTQLFTWSIEDQGLASPQEITSYLPDATQNNLSGNIYTNSDMEITNPPGQTSNFFKS